MMRWFEEDEGHNPNLDNLRSLQGKLQRVYKEKVLPLEREHLFHQFYSPELTDADFSSAPMVLLLGQYSTGKSTFIRHLLGRDYPNLRIGPEPTTDRFVAVLHGETDSTTPGNALVVDTSLPFTQLAHFGNNFLARLEAARLPSPVLEGLTLIDTPGVLAGEKQRLKRGYDFEGVVKWFADRADMILLLFDVSKLDISDEFRRVIGACRGNDTKIHTILNKADGVNTQQLLRVYGALMWSLGKVLDTPEVCRVFVGSFWDEKLQHEHLRSLFEKEETDLYSRLSQLPRTVTIRKVNDLIKRARLARVHAILLDYLNSQMPSWFGQAKEQERLIANLLIVYKDISESKGLPLGDFPDPKIMQDRLSRLDFTTFKPINPRLLSLLENVLSAEIPELLRSVSDAQDDMALAKLPQLNASPSPFSDSSTTNHWMVAPDVSMYREEFEELANGAERLGGQQVRPKMLKSNLPSSVLHRIWNMADCDDDGMVTLEEYSLAMHLIQMKLDGYDLPVKLPDDMIPKIS
uniref:Uncharacterized protein n=1 Tax=Noctiluca scintillans TaxID=2966 RepID=A0A7S1AAX7_NOCSC|mmetsp:Transcript_38839/g.103104  ORF Transcript_38839/g.103104 Transcript_38839/m.103104 type:complete len:520 (+) Transcript_38839:115-1674(+)|eukprot:CAMPEP_0194513028 /NCGR_PEP_ID=MMETSP0253-20130528/45201_1 /TAXON_ID=2966 /ORGANISM="Noctiluca scintillans" /LENGTH=519 /DNA_ID=CAMNT_0039356543 /DNA_START=33 /DNA_END=1592 /DNA_ORIENTATION=-